MPENIEIKILETKAKLFDLRLEGEKIQSMYNSQFDLLKQLIQDNLKSENTTA